MKPLTVSERQALIKHLNMCLNGDTFFDSMIEFNKRQREINKIALEILKADNTANGELLHRSETTGDIYLVASVPVMKPVKLPGRFQPVLNGGKTAMFFATDGHWLNLTEVKEAIKEAGGEVEE
ncbi:hypothetical protein [Pantoea cypripedii]|uniref:Uncharacterized protein n=1 Tax=Pantoea cypripedii TaxID=55209 RepID=A0A6B9GAV4_PANCY|nr:hypothetical protein [Pantoea cypripedii]QGY29805.1 hypothetical protein CUN67_13055 [Pantoea cypripedii]